MAFVAANLNFPDPNKKGKKKPEIEELCLEVKLDRVLRERVRKREMELDRLYAQRVKKAEAALEARLRHEVKHYEHQLKAAKFDAEERRKALRREMQKSELLHRRVHTAETRLLALAQQLQAASGRIRELTLAKQQRADFSTLAGPYTAKDRRQLFQALEQLAGARRRVLELEIMLEKANH